MKDIMKALEQNQSVKIHYRGKFKALITPSHNIVTKKVKQHPFFGMNANEETSIVNHLAKVRGIRDEDDR